MIHAPASMNGIDSTVGIASSLGTPKKLHTPAVLLGFLPQDHSLSTWTMTMTTSSGSRWYKLEVTSWNCTIPKASIDTQEPWGQVSLKRGDNGILHAICWDGINPNKFSLFSHAYPFVDGSLAIDLQQGSHNYSRAAVGKWTSIQSNKCSF